MKGQSKVKQNRYLITLQMKETNYKANMLQSEGFKSHLLYHDYCKPERERGRRSTFTFSNLADALIQSDLQ